MLPHINLNTISSLVINNHYHIRNGAIIPRRISFSLLAYFSSRTSIVCVPAMARLVHFHEVGRSHLQTDELKMSVQTKAGIASRIFGIFSGERGIFKYMSDELAPVI